MSAFDRTGQDSDRGASAVCRYDLHGELSLATLTGEAEGEQYQQLRTFTRNGLGWLVAAEDPEGGLVETLAFDVQGRPTFTRDANGRAQGFDLFRQYDAAGRPKLLMRDQGTATAVLGRWSYDGAGSTCPGTRDLGKLTGEVALLEEFGGTYRRCVQYSGRGGRPSRTHVTLELPDMPAWSFEQELEHGDRGQLSSLRYPTEVSCPPGGSCAYLPGDALSVSTTRGVADAVSFGGAGASPLLAARADAWAPNGSPTVVATGNGVTRTVTLDEQERVSRIAVRNVTGALLWDSGSQVYDGLEHVLAIGALGGPGVPGTHPQSFRHDAQGRLVHAELPTGDVDYSYDDFGNMTSRQGNLLPADSPGVFSGRRHFEAGVHDNRIHEEGFEHDPSGNLTLMPNPKRNLAWDAQGRLLRVEDVAGTLARMAYDTTGERVLVESNGELRYFHRGGAAAVLAEYVRSGQDWQLAREHVDGLDGSLGEVALDGPTPSVRYHGRDHLGTPRAMTDAGGVLTSLNLLEPFGMELPDTAGWETTHRFTGHERDDVTGLDYMHARYYSAESGRFVSRDPAHASANAAAPSTWGRYALGNNATVENVDPDGQSWLRFNGQAKTLTLFDRNDQRLGSWPAANNVSRQNKKGEWEDGTYCMRDTVRPNMHPGTPEADTPDGAFGSYGIFRARDFVESNGNTRTTMGVHSGRELKMDGKKRFGTEHATYGCIRTTDEAMELIAHTARTDALESITVETNKPPVASIQGSVDSGDGGGTLTPGIAPQLVVNGVWNY